jgi:hypothetical protein
VSTSDCDREGGLPGRRCWSGMLAALEAAGAELSGGLRRFLNPSAARSSRSKDGGGGAIGVDVAGDLTESTKELALLRPAVAVVQQQHPRLFAIRMGIRDRATW